LIFKNDPSALFVQTSKLMIVRHQNILITILNDMNILVVLSSI